MRKQLAAEQRKIHKQGRLLRLGFSALFYCYWIGYLVMNDLTSSVKLPLQHTLRAWRRGLTRFSYRLYGLAQGGNPAEYLSDYALFLRGRHINGRFEQVVNNKLVFGLLMERHGIPTPQILGVIRKGVLHAVDSRRAMNPTVFLRELLGPGERLALRSMDAFHGFGFMTLARTENGYQLNGEITPTDAVKDVIGKLDQYIVTEFVTQGEYSAQLYPYTVNTMRVVTFWDPETAEPFIARVVQRIGTSRSFPVDNFRAGKGGLSALIDIETGVLGPGAMAASDGHVSWHPYHPETHAPIEGVEVPGWPGIRRRLLEYAEKFAFVAGIGWDIVLTRAGFSVLEGNSISGMPVLQVHGPMLADPRIRRFYRHHRVIS